ncbi:MAG: GNAT family N-acetyltransferase [Pseudoxanthomonas suwonensis]|nr:GNAT family N-acetyltransferase [Pseudoxanthomonas suwonensis]
MRRDSASLASVRIDRVGFDEAAQHLHAVREAVFIQGQGVPAAIERDDRDAHCQHVLARDADGRPIGTGRLDADGRIGRLAVLEAYRGRGLGRAVLAELVAIAMDARLDALYLHAQATAVDFYLEQGWVPVGDAFQEAGIEHRDMHLPLRTPRLVNDADGARAALCGVVAHARRQCSLFVPQLDADLFDAAPVQAALRRHASGVRGAECRILLCNETASAHGPTMLALVQRLTSTFQLRVAVEPTDVEEPEAWLCNDRGGSWHMPMSNRHAGDYALDAPGMARGLRQRFEAVWERSRPASGLRALGL